MKTVKITYHCDYCKQVINTGDEPVCVLHPGRVGYQDSLTMQPEDEVQHYHEECMAYLLCLTSSNDKNLGPKEADVVKAAKPENKTKDKEKKDLPGLQALLDAGRSQKWCAAEFGVVPSTISVWKQEIEAMKAEGTWEDYCEERRRQ